MALCGVVPVAAIVPFFPADTYRTIEDHYCYVPDIMYNSSAVRRGMRVGCWLECASVVVILKLVEHLKNCVHIPRRNCTESGIDTTAVVLLSVCSIF